MRSPEWSPLWPARKRRWSPARRSRSTADLERIPVACPNYTRPIKMGTHTGYPYVKRSCVILRIFILLFVFVFVFHPRLRRRTFAIGPGKQNGLFSDFYFKLIAPEAQVAGIEGRLNLVLVPFIDPIVQNHRHERPRRRIFPCAGFDAEHPAAI